MKLAVDVHCHLDHALIRDRIPEMIENAKKAGVVSIVTNGLDKKTNRMTLDLSKRYAMVRPALGIYPPDALRQEIENAVIEGYMEKEELSSFEYDHHEEIEFIKKNISSIAAIGEIGLDYKDGKDKKMQKDIFCSLVELAKKKNKPILVHSRKAESDAVEILESYGHKKTIMHCFSGKKGLIRRSNDAGFSFSIPTNVVRSQHFQNLIAMVPLSRLMTETDAPFLSPFKERLNEPSFVVESLKKISEIKKTELEETEKAVYMNYMNMFE